jgi:hypothetical protein
MFTPKAITTRPQGACDHDDRCTKSFHNGQGQGALTSGTQDRRWRSNHHLGLSWLVMVFHGLSWFVMVCDGLSRFVMVCHGMSSFVLVFYGLSWFVMVCHGV